MPELQRLLFLVLLVALFGALSMGNKHDLKMGCSGDSIKLFERISFDNNRTTLFLHKNGDTNMMIAKWVNAVRTPETLNGYSDKLYLDKLGNIWFLSLRQTDDGNYTITTYITTSTNDSGNSITVELLVLVAPTPNCKPKITKVGDSLSAHADPTNCGKPTASVYWLEHSSISAAPEVIELQSGRHSCTYHACIKSEGMRCAKVFNLSDYCTVFKDHASFSDNSPLNTPGMILAILLMIAVLWTFVIGMVIWKIVILRKKIAKPNRKSEEELQAGQPYAKERNRKREEKLPEGQPLTKDDKATTSERKGATPSPKKGTSSKS